MTNNKYKNGQNIALQSMIIFALVWFTNIKYICILWLALR